MILVLSYNFAPPEVQIIKAHRIIYIAVGLKYFISGYGSSWQVLKNRKVPQEDVALRSPAR